MTPPPAFVIVYAHQVKEHLAAIDRRYQRLLREAIEANLHFEPDVETTNRKPLKRPVAFEAQWELRCGPNNKLRVYYEVNMQNREVHVAAIGVKEGNRLRIGGEEIAI